MEQLRLCELNINQAPDAGFLSNFGKVYELLGDIHVALNHFYLAVRADRLVVSDFGFKCCGADFPGKLKESLFKAMFSGALAGRNLPQLGKVLR